MELSTLRIFLEVADEGSVTRAAQRLHYVQSNVTARIRQLEEELGSRLFERRPRGMELTPSGQVLEGYARRLLQTAEQAQRAVAEADQLWSPLTLGSVASIASVRLGPLMVRYHQEYPQVDLHLVTDRPDRLMDMVVAGNLDAAFLNAPVGHGRLKCVTAFAEDLVLVCGAGAERLTEDPHPPLLVLPPWCPYRARLLEWLRDRGAVPGQIMELASLDLILGCAAAGMGITLVPGSAVEASPYADRLTVKPLGRRLGRLEVVLARRKEGAVTRSLRALVAML